MFIFGRIVLAIAEHFHPCKAHFLSLGCFAFPIIWDAPAPQLRSRDSLLGTTFASFSCFEAFCFITLLHLCQKSPHLTDSRDRAYAGVLFNPKLAKVYASLETLSRTRTYKQVTLLKVFVRSSWSLPLFSDESFKSQSSGW